ncbi:DUF3027 domain-containing protein [Microbacterium jiangjiandongii]|uniref:DUF3027 domain-containing protein n=1 Tax=Microbacterium jiangjiandongii TaxID=3049071 RepID=UPI00214CF7D8|nr:DUF3027 domain-containing protein [Microbacterium sp. zg.Y843]MCR2816566.1 DUF3027 domain-containing protein [Microbacterium sp. zg.Y843]
MTSKPEPADERLLHAHDIARAALREVTPDATVGDAAGYTLEDDGVVSLRFNNRMPGYPGWFWTVSVAVVEGSDPTVLEVELLPGDGALLAPEWVPWAVRLADYQAAQEAQAEAARAAGELTDADADERDADEDDDVDIDDLDDLDAADFDDDGSAILHGGDLDGVDIDELDESGDVDASFDDAVDDDDEDDAYESDEDDDESDEDDESDDDDDESDEDDDESDSVS